MAAYQPLSSLQYLSKVQSQAKPLPVNNTVPGLLQSLAPKAPGAGSTSVGAVGTKGGYDTAPGTVQAPIGVKTASPQDNIKTPTNTTPQPQVVKPASSPSSTQGGTQNTNTQYAYGRAPDDPLNQYNTATGQLNTNYKDPNAPAPQNNASAPITGNTTTPSGAVVNATTGATVSTPNPYQASNNGLYGQLVTDLANKSNNQSPIATTAGNTLNSLSQTESPEVAQARANLEALQRQHADNTKNIAGTAGFLTQQNGEQGLENSRYADFLGASQSALSNALTSQGQQIGAATSAGGIGNSQQGLIQQALQQAGSLTSPQMQFGQLTNPLTGNPVNGGSYGGNPQLQGAVQQAVQLVQNGASINDPSVQSLLSTFGLPGQSAFTQAMQQVSNGTYNPTAQNTQVATNQAQGANYQQQATQMDTALKQLDVIQPNVVNFLSTSGLNSNTNPDINAALNTYYGKFLNPGNKAIFEQYIGDIKKYTGQILAAGSGTIPTDVSNTLSTFDPTLLTAPQLTAYLDNLKKLGGNQLSVLQGQTSSSYGNSGGYSGSPTNVNNTNVTAPANAASTNPTNNKVIQAMAGAGLNFFGGITNAISGLASHLLN